jgi:osmotically-inducible protein OsmY
MNKALLWSLAIVCACGCSRNEPAHAADNTRTKSAEALTPMDQSETEADRELTRKIRQALLAEPALSTNAKNAKVITQNGKVTLRGVVESQQEKDDVAARARAVSGVTECDNLLEVKRN